MFAASLPQPALLAPVAGVLWIGMARLDDWIPWLDEATDLLDAAERGRALRKHRPSDRDGLILSYALHRLFIGAWMGIDPTSVALARDGEGRPLVHGASLSTSLSHAEHAVAFAVHAGGAVGIDVEGAHRSPVMEEIAARVGHADELRALAGRVAAERHKELLKLWVRKEAYLKAVGVGLAWDMHTFSAPTGVALPLLEGRNDTVVLTEIDALSGHVVAVAAAAEARLLPMVLVPGPSA